MRKEVQVVQEEQLVDQALEVQVLPLGEVVVEVVAADLVLGEVIEAMVNIKRKVQKTTPSGVFIYLIGGG